MNRIDRLINLSFGGDVAEHEDLLDTYFLRTPAFWAVTQDEADLILGAKGSGKSAIARYLSSPTVDIEQVGDVLVMPAFNVRGSVLYRRLATENRGLDETDFRDLFLALMVGIAGNYVIRTFNDATDVTHLEAALRDSGLVVDDPTIDGIWRRALRRIRPRLKTTVAFDATGMPLVSGTAEFGEADSPPSAPESSPAIDILEVVLHSLYDVLDRLNLRCWIVFDRLDEAFPNDLDLERVALRGLLRAHLDATSFGSRFRSKLFLRLDVYERITEEAGFVNATHLRTLRISWDSDSIFHVIAMRMYESEADQTNRAFIESNLGTVQGRRKIVRSIMPSKINQTQCLVWLMLVTTDATREFNPRNILTLLRLARGEAIQIATRESHLGHQTLLPARALTAAFKQLSIARLQDTIFAESQAARMFVDQLRGRRTKFSVDELSATLRLSGDDLDGALRELRYVGFLRLDGESYIVPPLFRPAIFVAVHGAELNIEIPAHEATDPDGSALPSNLIELGDDSATPGTVGEADELPAAIPNDVAAPRRRRSRGGRRSRNKASDRDELVPTNMQSEAEHESDFAGLLAAELPDEKIKSHTTSLGKAVRHSGPVAGDKVGRGDLSIASSVIKAARELGDQGQALAGFHLLWPSHVSEVGPACAAADLAFASRDLTALIESHRILAESDTRNGAIVGRLLALSILDNVEGLPAIWAEAGATDIQKIVPAVLRIVAMAPAEEARWWKQSFGSVDNAADSLLANIWPVLAASRILAMCRHNWEQGIDPATLDSLSMRRQLWDDASWSEVEPKIVTYLEQYAENSLADAPEVLPYQILSLVTLVGADDSMSALREGILKRLTRTLAVSDPVFQDRFLEWARYVPFVLQVEFPTNVRASRARAILQGQQLHPRTIVDASDKIEAVMRDSRARNHDEMLLSELGVHLRQRWPSFSSRQYGCASLFQLLQKVERASSEFELDRNSKGHPFVRWSGDDD